MNIIILGAGLVGTPMAIDLSKINGSVVTAVDIDEKLLEKIPAKFGIKTIRKDLSDPAAITDLVRDFDMVINATPGYMGFRTLKACIVAGKNVIDIAFFPEDPLELDDLAKKHDVTVITDCGVSPGMSNILSAYSHSLLDTTESVLILVGGLPVIREWPYEYKAVFSPCDVIEEYTRPARFVENGMLVIKPALTDPELMDFEGVGTLEAFNSDGLRSLLTTITDIPNMKEKTLRYPGHIEKMRMLRETGFFDETEIEINGAKIKPLDFTSKLLFPKWKQEEGDHDITVMRVIARGMKKGKPAKISFDLFDRYDVGTGIHSMARTTGYTATVAAQMVHEGLYTAKGISPPEYLGSKPECVEFLLNGLKERGVIYTMSEEVIE